MAMAFGISWHFLRVNIFLILCALFGVVFFVLLPGVIFIISLVEKCRASEYQPTAPCAEEDIPARCRAARDEAAALGFATLGCYVDGDKGVLAGHIIAMLSPDATVLLLAQWAKFMARYKIMSRLADGRWIITGDTAGIADLSGVDEEEVVQNGKFQDALQHHTLRLGQHGQYVALFAPETFTKELFAQNARRVERLVSLGLATQLPSTDVVYRHTMKGALRVTANYFNNMIQAFQKKPVIKGPPVSLPR